MGSWVFPTSMLLLCLIQGSQQGGLAPQGNGIMGWFFSSTHMKGVPPGAGPGAGAGIPPGKAGYGTLSNGYGAGAPNGAGAGPRGPETKAGPGAQNGYGAGYRNGLGAGIFPGAGAQPGLGGGMKPQKAAYRNGLGNGAFPAAGAQPGPGAGTKPQKPGYGNGVFPGVGAQSGGGMKPQKAGYGNGLGHGGFPGSEAQPGFGAGTKPQKAGFGAGTKIQRAGNGNGIGAGAFPEARALPGPCNGGSIPALPPRPPNGVGPATGSPSEKGGFRTQNGYGPVSPPGLEDGLKTQKTGLRNVLGAGSFPGARIQPGYAAMNGYGTGLTGAKSQKTGYGNGLGAGAFPETGPQPGFGTLNGFGGGPGGVKPQKAIYSNGLGAGAFPEIQQTGFPGAGSYPANGYSNGYGAGGPGYPKPSLYENGGASSFGAQGVLFLPGGSEAGAKTAKHDYGNGVGPSSYPADESPPDLNVQPSGSAGPGMNHSPSSGDVRKSKIKDPSLRGLYGQLRPEPVPGTYGGPDVKHNFNGFLGNGYRGRCPPGKC